MWPNLRLVRVSSREWVGHAMHCWMGTWRTMTGTLATPAISSAAAQLWCSWHSHMWLEPSGTYDLNPLTPESDQCQISPAASPEILHHTVRRTWLFIAYSDERWLYYKFSLHHLCIFSLKGLENVLFKLRSERVNLAILWYFPVTYNAILGKTLYCKLLAGCLVCNGCYKWN